MALMKHALLSGSRRHIRERGTGIHYHLCHPKWRRLYWRRCCNAGLLDRAVLDAGPVSLLEGMFQVWLTLHWQRKPLSEERGDCTSALSRRRLCHRRSFWMTGIVSLLWENPSRFPPAALTRLIAFPSRVTDGYIWGVSALWHFYSSFSAMAQLIVT